MNDFWRGKKVLVTGGHGFLGSYVCKKLAGLGASVTAPTHEEYDLVDRDQVIKMYKDNPADMVIHLAAVVPMRPGRASKRRVHSRAAGVAVADEAADRGHLAQRALDEHVGRVADPPRPRVERAVDRVAEDRNRIA
jgi:nucleoside-diphosphate-sugar epimerase